MSAALRYRTAARGWVTRAGNAIRYMFEMHLQLPYFVLLLHKQETNGITHIFIELKQDH